MNTKATLLAAVVVGMSAMSAHAATFNLGTVTDTAGFNNTIGAGLTFTDTWTFELASTVDVGMSVTNVATAISGLYGITGFAGTLAGETLTFTTNSIGGLDVTVGAGSALALTAGTYDLVLTGTASASGASYGGNIIATPVPEPETLAMMLAGLGTLGFLNRRRQRH